MGEFSLIDIIRQRCASSRSDVVLGIGDDAALVEVPPGNELVICTDTLVAGVHFPVDTSAFDIGWKALAVNLSDLAAMGATPAWALLALTLPKADADFVRALADGFSALASVHDVALVGGDTTQGPLSISVTVHGFVPKGQALRRSGAQVGDRVFVSGTLGDAAAALHLLESEHLQRAVGSPDAGLLVRLNRPQARLACGVALRSLASACIDVSDGLLADLGHVAHASGVAIDIDRASLPTSAQLAARFTPEQRTCWQLAGGDDYELAFTVPAERIDAVNDALTGVGCAITCIGRVVEGEGVRVLDSVGNEITPPRGGWEHFS